MAGASWLGVATPTEALALRAAGDTGRLLCWLYGPSEDLSPLVAADVDVSAASAEDVSRLVAAAAVTERVARVHLKVDTGLTRNGAPEHGWDELFAAAAEAVDAGALTVVGPLVAPRRRRRARPPVGRRSSWPRSTARTPPPGSPASSRSCATWPTRPAR